MITSSKHISYHVIFTQTFCAILFTLGIKNVHNSLEKMVLIPSWLFVRFPKLRDSILTRMYLASATEERFKSHLLSPCEYLERGIQEKKPVDTLNRTVNCLETVVLFTDSVSSYGLPVDFEAHDIQLVVTRDRNRALREIERPIHLDLSRSWGTMRNIFTAARQFFSEWKFLEWTDVRFRGFGDEFFGGTGKLL